MGDGKRRKGEDQQYWIKAKGEEASREQLGRHDHDGEEKDGWFDDFEREEYVI